MRDYFFTVNPATSDQVFFGPSNYIRIESCAVPLRISINDGRSFLLSQGEAVKIAPFERLDFSHTSGIAQPVTVVVGKDVEKISALISGVVSGAVSIAQGTTQNHSSVAVSKTVAALLVPALATRRAVIFQNWGATSVYIGSSAGVTAGLGIEVPCGAFWIEDIAAAGAWYAKQLNNLGGSSLASVVAITELI